MTESIAKLYNYTINIYVYMCLYMYVYIKYSLSTYICMYVYVYIAYILYIFNVNFLLNIYDVILKIKYKGNILLPSSVLRESICIYLIDYSFMLLIIFILLFIKLNCNTTIHIFTYIQEHLLIRICCSYY